MDALWLLNQKYLFAGSLFAAEYVVNSGCAAKPHSYTKIQDRGPERPLAPFRFRTVADPVATGFLKDRSFHTRWFLALGPFALRERTLNCKPAFSLRGLTGMSSAPDEAHPFPDATSKKLIDKINTFIMGCVLGVIMLLTSDFAIDCSD